MTQPSGANRMQVTVTIANPPAFANNLLLALHFQSFTNALVDVPNGRTSQFSPFIHKVSAAMTQATFYVRRISPDAPTTVQFAVQDGCGQWQTFVGGAPGSF